RLLPAEDPQRQAERPGVEPREPQQQLQRPPERHLVVGRPPLLIDDPPDLPRQSLPEGPVALPPAQPVVGPTLDVSGLSEGCRARRPGPRRRPMTAPIVEVGRGAGDVRYQ